MLSGLPGYFAQTTAGALEKCINRALGIDLKPFMLAIPEKLSASVLDAKAEAVSLKDGDGWQNAVTLAEKCTAIKKAVPTHRFKGSVKGLKSVLNADITYLEWREYGGIPYHYKLIIEREKYVKSEVYGILREIENVKRLSAKQDGYEAVISAKTPVNTASTAKIEMTVKSLPKTEEI